MMPSDVAAPTALVWLHGGSLSSTDPALLENPNAPAIFVFDKPFLESNHIAFARLQFMFEGVLEAFSTRAAPVRICVGVQAEQILAFAREHGCTQIHATQIPSPELERTLDALEAAGMQVMLHDLPTLTSFSGRVKRFSAFWKAVEREVLHG
jgi:deoxyribodipyrimidine photo-lyase